MTKRTTPAPAPSLVTVFGRAAAAEWTRLTTLRSTWWSLLTCAVLMLFMGAAFGADFAGERTPVWFAAEYAIVPGQFPLLLIVLLTMTAEYSTGVIRSSLQWVPARGILLAARTTVAVAAATVGGVLLAAATDLVAWFWLGADAVVGVSELANSLGTIAVVVATGGLLTTGLATVLRSTAGTLTAVFLLLLGLPGLLPEFDVAWLTAAAERLPGWISVSLLEAMEIDVPLWQTVATLAAWIATATFAGMWAFMRRDAL